MNTRNRFEFDLIAEDMLIRRAATHRTQPLAVDPARAAAAYRRTADVCKHAAIMPAVW